ncbi:MAG: PTS sugar transporter subunit IIC [Elusimicrobiaceae bacterium]|nr:PTS sugar transporter subunit IIC [Elusimicrobiaceae bacterium]
MTQILLLCILGALLELDTTYAFQLTFSRGIIAGPLLSLITGDLMTGLQVGVFTELIFIDISPLGGLLPPSGAVCCTLTMALCSLGIPTYFAFFFGVIGAVLFSVCEVFVRKHRSVWLARQEYKMTHTPGYLRIVVIKALALSFFMTLAFVLFYSAVVGGAFARLLPFLPDKLHLASKFAFMAVPWIGLATLVSTFRLKAR